MKTNQLKNDTRSTYASPVSKVVYLKVQGVFCQSLQYGAPGSAGGDVVPGNTYDL